MNDRPIIFSAPMIKALMQGRKSQTRRVLKLQPSRPECWAGTWVDAEREQSAGCMDGERAITPYEAGDRLWVREACGRRPASFLGIEATNGVESAFYLADEEDVLEQIGFNLCPWWKGKTGSPRFMPRVASRLTLDVTDVRVQRLQDISEADAEAEGCAALPFPGPWWQGYMRDDCDGSLIHQQAIGEEPPDWMIEPHRMAPTPHLDRSASDEFRSFWLGLHGPDAWSANPWVCAISFRAIKANIDSLEAALERAD